MLDGRYRLTVNTKIGEIEVIIDIAVTGEVADLTASVPGFGQHHVTGIARNDSFAAKGKVRIPILGKVEYVVAGHVDGDDLMLQLETNKGDRVTHAHRVYS